MLPSNELLKFPAEESLSQSDRWTWVRTFAVRVISVYLLLFTFPGPLSRVPGINWLYTVRWTLEPPVIAWTAKSVFHLQNPGSPNGSDTVFRYIEVFCFLVLAVVIASVWSAIDRTQKHDKQVQQAFRLYLRYTLAFFMFGYGTVKILKSQFPSLGPSVLQQTYGDSTPMELLWAFMGY